MCALTRLVVVKLIYRYLAAKLIKCFFHGSEQTEKFRIFGESLALIRQQPERVSQKTAYRYLRDVHPFVDRIIGFLSNGDGLG